jgi:FtsH-binding integral membrane protein
MSTRLRWFLATAAALFLLAALVHAGALIPGHEHTRARIAETVIGLVLVIGFAGTLLSPAATRSIAIGALGFALLGVIVGVFTIATGIGPRTQLDLVIHAAMFIVLAIGLLVALRADVHA